MCIRDRKLVAGLIYLDNYEEALESVEEVRRSLLTALIDRKISKYIASMNGIVKKIEKEKYFFAICQQHMAKMQESRFPILEDVDVYKRQASFLCGSSDREGKDRTG